VRSGRLLQSIRELQKKLFEEQLQEIYLMRVHNKSYLEFREEVLSNGGRH